MTMLRLLSTAVVLLVGAQQPVIGICLIAGQRDSPESRVVNKIVEKIQQVPDEDLVSLSRGGDDPLLFAAKILYDRSYQRRIRRTLEEEFGLMITERDLSQKLAELDGQYNEATVRRLRRELREGRPITQGWPWPLCLIGGC